MNYIQHYYDQPLTVVFREDKALYFSALEQSRQMEDMTPFRKFMYAQHIKSLEHQLIRS